MSVPTHKILVVDDDPDIGIMIKMMLEYKGYTVLVTDRAERTRSLITEFGPDLIIMDMLLSGMNGTDICRELKADESSAGIPLMMISAHPNAKETCLKAGANDFIAKPFDMQELLGKINKLTEV